MKLRVQPGLAIQGTPTNLCLVDPINNRSIDEAELRQPGLLAFLAECREWTDEPVVEKRLSVLTNSDFTASKDTITYLLEVGLLQSDENIPYGTALRSLPKWREYGWEEPFLLQWHINAHPKLNYSEDGERIDREKMRKIVSEEALPSNYKDIPTTRSVPLSKPTGRFSHASIQATMEHHVGQSKPNQEIDLETISWLTYLSFGQTFVRQLHVTGEHVAKTSPSGGSRHPIEVYPILLDVKDSTPGIYHYNVRRHGLDLISKGNFLGFLREEVIRHPERPGFTPKAAFIYSCIFERSMYRYRDARSYRVMQHDLGHVMQTTAMAASAAGLSSYRGYSLNERAVERLINIDGLFESAFAFCVVG